MKNCKITAALGMAAAVGSAASLFLCAPGRLEKAQKAPFTGINYAHRGLHTPDKSVPENSLAAFRLAAQAGYGIELDVQLSRDGQVVVFHDDTLDRVCGVSGRVEERSFLELQELRLCGTAQRIPLLLDVLANIEGCSALIVELKRGSRNSELCEKTYEILKTYKGVYCIESFEPRIVAWFRKNAPEVVRGQLAAPMKDYEGQVSKPVAFGASRCLMNFAARPNFIAYKIGCRPLIVHIEELLGAMKFGWTSHEEKNERFRDGVIFEFYCPKKKYK